MFPFWATLACTLGFLGLLSFIAWYTDRLNRSGQVVRPVWVYVLTLAVYGTSWTFFGSVGLAKGTGLSFLPVYLGPTLAMPLWVVLVRKQIRLTRKFRISSISDMLAARYGKSLLVGAVAAAIMVIGQIPYITLQIRSIASTFNVLTQPGDGGWLSGQVPLTVTVILVVISIYFGARTLDPAERHEGLLGAVAFDSAFKLAAFLVAGMAILFFMFHGPKDLLVKSLDLPQVANFFTLKSSPLDWFLWTAVSGLAFLLLPHVYQAAVIGNHGERDVGRAAWMFPLYLLAINIFVIPVALAGLIIFQNTAVAGDTYMLALPLQAGMPWLTLLVYLAGLGAGAGMAILAAVALSAMLTNNLVLPVLLHIRFLKLQDRGDLSGLILGTRRVSLAFLFFLAWMYGNALAHQKSLVSIGLISFVAIIQLAPAMIGGLFWKGANRKGALAGMVAGFAVWAWTLPIPSLAESSMLPPSLLTDGPFGLSFLRPYHLFGMTGLDEISHSAFWSMLVNTGLFVLISNLTKARALETHQAEVFVDILNDKRLESAKAWKVNASFREIEATLNKYMGLTLAKKEITAWLDKKQVKYLGEKTDFTPDPEFMDHVETLIAGVIGQASARVMVGKMASENELSYQDMVSIMDESSEIKRTSAELKVALTTVQKLKDQQDGDYFLTSLLLDPFQGPVAGDATLPVSFHLEQKKAFEFKGKTYQLGGDLVLAGGLQLMGQPYTLVASADAMGKSIQGAGGALVFAAILRNVLNINRLQPDRGGHPEPWLKNLYRELQNVFLTFDGSMFISAVVGLVNHRTGEFHFFNAEHPYPVLLRDGEATFLEKEITVHKLGVGTNPDDIEIDHATLKPGDRVILGSDGRDDVVFHGTQQMNEDEYRFVRCVKKAEGSVPAIAHAVKEGVKITDDFSILSVTFQPPAM